jgi:hypothetical protein
MVRVIHYHIDEQIEHHKADRTQATWGPLSILGSVIALTN